MLIWGPKPSISMRNVFVFHWFWDIQWAISHFDSMRTYCSFCVRFFMAFLQLNTFVVLKHKIQTNSGRVFTKKPMKVYSFTAKIQKLLRLESSNITRWQCTKYSHFLSHLLIDSANSLAATERSNLWSQGSPTDACLITTWHP